MGKEDAEANKGSEWEVGQPYFDPFLGLQTNLRLLRQLNQELHKSIDDVKRTKQDALLDRLKSDVQSFEEVSRVVKALVERAKESLDQGKDLQLFQPMSDRAIRLLNEAIGAIIVPDKYTAFVRNMSLVYLIAEFESFLQEVLRITFEIKPEILISSKKSITLEELIKLKDIADAKRQVMRKELMSVAGQDVDEISKYLEQKFGIQLSRFTDWKRLKERFYRRNIIVHNSGRVDDIYRAKTGYRGMEIELTVTGKYLDKSITMFEDVSSNITRFFNDKFG